MPKPPVFESVWTNKVEDDPVIQARWDEWLNCRRPKSPEDVEAAHAYANEFSIFAPYIARTMRANSSLQTFRFKKAKVVVSKLAEGWWKAEFYRWKTEAERSRLSAIFEPYAFTLPDAPRTGVAAESAHFPPLPTELRALVRELQRRRTATAPSDANLTREKAAKARRLRSSRLSTPALAASPGKHRVANAKGAG